MKLHSLVYTLHPSVDDGVCTFHEAVNAVNTNSASGITSGECIAGDPNPVVDIIEFDPNILPAHFTTTTTLNLVESVEIRGSGRDLVSITNILGTRAFFIKNNSANATFSLSDLSLVDNQTDPNLDDSGAAINVFLSGNSQLTLQRIMFRGNIVADKGGAIYINSISSDNLTLIKDCTFENNQASSQQGNVAGGGAINIGGNQNVVIQNSTFLNNQVNNSNLLQPLEDASGGAILIRSALGFESILSIEDSTFSGNTATGVGGAIAIEGPGFPINNSSVTIKRSTITLNTSDANNNHTLSGGGGIYTSSQTNLKIVSTIVANNSDNAQITATDIEIDLTANITSLGYNLIGDNSTVSSNFPAGVHNVNNDIVGTNVAPIDPQLNPIDDNSGPTQTHLPLNSSDVIDQGKCIVANQDQRHFFNSVSTLRIVDIASIPDAIDGCDIGAVELNTTTSNPFPIALNDSFQFLEGQMLSVNNANGLLSNDSDNNPLVVITPNTLDLTGTAIVGTGLIGINGNLNYQTSDPDANGQAVFQYEITDQFNISSADVTFTVTPVNDAPSFTSGSLSISANNNQTYTESAWASDISSGPANESSQTLTFNISLNAASGFFSTAPTVNSLSGDLSFLISSNATGTAELTIVLHDSGGVSNNGINDSAATIVTIQISDIIFTNGFE